MTTTVKTTSPTTTKQSDGEQKTAKKSTKSAKKSKKPPSKSQVKKTLRGAILSSEAFGSRIDYIDVDIESGFFSPDKYVIEVSYVLDLPLPKSATPEMAEERSAKTAIEGFSAASKWNIEKGFIQVYAWVPIDFDSMYSCYDPNGQVGSRDTTGFISRVNRNFKQIKSIDWETYSWEKLTQLHTDNYEFSPGEVGKNCP